MELRLAAAGWLGGFGNPPPSPPPPPWLASWRAGWRAPGKPPKYAVHHCTASSHAWYGYGDGFARVGGSATFQEHPYLILQGALPSEPPIKNNRITALDVSSTANVVVTDVNLRVHNCPQSEIYTIHIAIYIPRHLSKEHLRLQLLIPRHVTQHKVIHLLDQSIVTLILVMGNRHVIMHHICKRNCFVLPHNFTTHSMDR